MSAVVDQFARYRKAIETGSRIEWERGDVASGFYKQNAGPNAHKSIEAIAIYRDDAGKLQCIRDVYGDGSRMDADQIEELFASVCLYPVPEDVYRGVTERGEAWPPEYSTRLTMKDQQAGVAWTPEYGRKRLGSNTAPDQAAENPRAVMGGNSPPEQRTPDAALLAEISASAATVKAWLVEIGGTPRNKAEADRLADHATTFKRLSDKAERARTEEKEPHLQAGREIDAKWKGVKSNADNARKRCLELTQAWMDAENRRRAEEARKAQEDAEKAAKRSDAPPPALAPEPEKITGVGNMRTVATRTRAVWIVTDPRAYAAHLLAQDETLPGELTEALGKIAQRRAVEAPGVIKDTIRSAA